MHVMMASCSSLITRHVLRKSCRLLSSANIKIGYDRCLEISNLTTLRHYSDSRKVVSVENGETIIRSPYPDVEHCDKTFGEYMLSWLDEFKNLELMVSIDRSIYCT